MDVEGYNDAIITFQSPHHPFLLMKGWRLLMCALIHIFIPLMLACPTNWWIERDREGKRDKQLVRSHRTPEQWLKHLKWMIAHTHTSTQNPLIFPTSNSKLLEVTLWMGLETSLTAIGSASWDYKGLVAEALWKQSRINIISVAYGTPDSSISQPLLWIDSTGMVLVSYDWPAIAVNYSNHYCMRIKVITCNTWFHSKFQSVCKVN